MLTMELIKSTELFLTVILNLILMISNVFVASDPRRVLHHGRTSTSNFKFDLKMPGASPHRPEQYICTARRLSSDCIKHGCYVVEYEPHASQKTAHHILIFGCTGVYRHHEKWGCGGAVCSGEEKIIFAWAKDAPTLKLPKGVGFKVGGDTGIKYIAMQIHYARALKVGEYDHSGITLHMVSRRSPHRPKYLASIYMFGNDDARIPPKAKGYHADMVCKFKRHEIWEPFAFRTHAHSLGRVISAYRIRDGKWSLIGIGNPQRPQAFYPVKPENKMRIRYGDVLAARCTYDAPNRTRTTYIGSTSHDEMCNFYMMYYSIKQHRATRQVEEDFMPRDDDNDDSDEEPDGEDETYADECSGIAVKVKFPPDSDKLPPELMINGSKPINHAMGDVGGDPGDDQDRVPAKAGSDNPFQIEDSNPDKASDKVSVPEDSNQSLSDRFKFDLKMPGASPRRPEQYICTYRKLPPKCFGHHGCYIVEYEPHASQKTAHHILMYGCTGMDSHRKMSTCGGMYCKGQKLLYAWAKDAPALKLPEGVGFKVGGDTGIKYIMMQIHYARALKVGELDHSGIFLHLTQHGIKHTASTYIFADGGAAIPPKAKGYHADMVCKFSSRYIGWVPFAFRTHSHSLGRVISAYRVRNGKWSLIGIGNPQRPQAFYPVKPENKMQIRYGDIMAARCTYDAPNRTRTTYIGSTSHDEMCNFYMMYYSVNRQRVRRHGGDDFIPRDIDDDEGPGGEDFQFEECSGVAVKLQFPPSSDKLPPELMINGSKAVNHAMGDTGGGEDGVDHNGIDQVQGGDHDESTASSEPTNSIQKPKMSDTDTSKSAEKSNDKTAKVNSHPKPHVNSASGSKKEKDNAVEKGMDSDLDQLPVDGEETQNLDGEDASKGPSHTTPKHASHIAKASTDDKLDHRSIGKPSVDGDWPYKREGLKDLGQVSGVAISKDGHIVVFHRGPRKWDGNTFDDTFRMHGYGHLKPINQPTILHLDPESGDVIKKQGENMFYLPHGLTIDVHDNIWVTDVGSHQVMKFTSNGQLPTLKVGERHEPGDDDDHFCQPADIAVEKSGIFYVADGYCNSRIMKFSSHGKLLKQWGRANNNEGAVSQTPGEFAIPHSLALDEKHKRLYVADRENGRIQVFNTDGHFISQFRSEEFGTSLFAITFNPAHGGILYAVNGRSFDAKEEGVVGFTINAKTGAILNKWSPSSKGFTRPHDIQSCPDNSAVYVVEIGPNRVWKFVLPKTPAKQPTKASSGSKSSTSQASASHSKLNQTEDEDELKIPPPKVKKPQPDDPSIVPAVVVIVVLATPVCLICVAAVIQHIRMKHKRKKLLRQRDEDSLLPRSRGGCCGCCYTSKYYYDNKRGFDKLIGDTDDSDDDDYFIRKGAI